MTRHPIAARLAVAATLTGLALLGASAGASGPAAPAPPGPFSDGGLSPLPIQGRDSSTTPPTPPGGDAGAPPPPTAPPNDAAASPVHDGGARDAGPAARDAGPAPVRIRDAGAQRR